MSPRRAGRARAPSEPGPSHPGQLVKTGGPQAWARVARECWSSPRDLGHGPSRPGQLVQAAGPCAWPESPGAAGPGHGTTDQSPCRPRLMVDIDGPQTLARVARDSLSTQRAHGPGPRAALESWFTPRAFGHERETPGELVDPTGPRTQAQVAQESWWNPRALAPEPESPGRAGRPSGHSDLSTSPHET